MDQFLAAGKSKLTSGQVTVSKAAATATAVYLLGYLGSPDIGASLRYGNIVPGFSFTIYSSNPADDRWVSWAICSPDTAW